MGQFGGFVQALEAIGVIDRASGFTLAIDVDGKIGINDLPDIVIAPNQVVSIAPIKLTPIGYEQITVSGVALGLTPPAGTDLALIQNQTNGVQLRWRDDGVDPNSGLAGVGMEFNTGVQFEYSVTDFTKWKVIRSPSGGSSLVNVSYYSHTAS